MLRGDLNFWSQPLKGCIGVCKQDQKRLNYGIHNLCDLLRSGKDYFPGICRQTRR